MLALKALESSLRRFCLLAVRSLYPTSLGQMILDGGSMVGAKSSGFYVHETVMLRDTVDSLFFFLGARLSKAGPCHFLRNAVERRSGDRFLRFVFLNHDTAQSCHLPRSNTVRL